MYVCVCVYMCAGMSNMSRGGRRYTAAGAFVPAREAAALAANALVASAGAEAAVAAALAAVGGTRCHRIS